MRPQEKWLAMRFVDTNIFIHYLFPNVDLKKHESCALLFEKSSKKEIDLWTSEWVIAELVWFLYRKNKPWSEIKNFIIEGILKGQQIKVNQGALVLQIIENSKNDSDFVDLMNKHILSQKEIHEGYSYDRGLDNWKSFKRLEP